MPCACTTASERTRAPLSDAPLPSTWTACVTPGPGADAVGLLTVGLTRALLLGWRQGGDGAADGWGDGQAGWAERIGRELLGSAGVRHGCRGDGATGRTAGRFEPSDARSVAASRGGVDTGVGRGGAERVGRGAACAGDMCRAQDTSRGRRRGTTVSAFLLTPAVRSTVDSLTRASRRARGGVPRAGDGVPRPSPRPAPSAGATARPTPPPPAPAPPLDGDSRPLRTTRRGLRARTAKPRGSSRASGLQEFLRVRPGQL